MDITKHPLWGKLVVTKDYPKDLVWFVGYNLKYNYVITSTQDMSLHGNTEDLSLYCGRRQHPCTREEAIEHLVDVWKEEIKTGTFILFNEQKETKMDITKHKLWGKPTIFDDEEYIWWFVGYNTNRDLAVVSNGERSLWEEIDLTTDWKESKDKNLISSYPRHKAIKLIKKEYTDEIKTGTFILFNEKQEKNKMSKVKQALVETKERSIRAGKAAIALEVGEAGLNIAKDQLKKVVPIPEEYMDHPLADILIAQLTTLIIAGTAPDNELAETVTEAMLTVAMQRGLKTVNVTGLATQLVDKIGPKKVEALKKK